MADDSVEFSVVLHSTTDVSTQSLCMPTIPETVGDLQGHIETRFSVPRCCQSVVFEGNTLHRDDSLRAYSARSGDTFHIYYKSDADVEDIRNVVDSMERTLTLVEHHYNAYPDYYQPKQKFCRERVLSLIRVFEQQINPEIVGSLATHYFQPSGTEHTMANKLYFIDIGGLSVLHSLYSVAVKYPWDVTVVTLQRLERAILRVLWNISATFTIQSQLLRYPIIDLCVKSALRVPVEYRKKLVAPIHLAYATNPSPIEDQEFFLGENLYKACGVLFNMAELPQYQVRIAAEPGLLNQATLLALCPSYYSIASLVTISGMVCLAYNTGTHRYLVEANILERIEELRQPIDSDLDDDETKTQVLFRYFVALMYALIIASSAHLIPEAELHNMCTFVNSFLFWVDPDDLHRTEQKNGYVWSTLRPHFKLAYTPISVRLPRVVLELSQIPPSFLNYFDFDDDHSVSLQRLCAKIGILSLQNMLQREQTRQVLKDEDLVDYVVCMPWSVVQGTELQQRARDLVKLLGRFMKLEPPSLANIARAKLAADTFGLERVMNAYSVHDLIPS